MECQNLLWIIGKDVALLCQILFVNIKKYIKQTKDLDNRASMMYITREH